MGFALTEAEAEAEAVLEAEEELILKGRMEEKDGRNVGRKEAAGGLFFHLANRLSIFSRSTFGKNEMYC